jgi:hypothetical protein
MWTERCELSLAGMPYSLLKMPNFMQDWQRFERLAQIIQAQLSPDATVTHNERLRGRSGVEHQCDLVVRSKVGQFDFTCVFECKDHAEKVGLEIARGVASKIEDLGVHKGVIVSASGFTPAALTFAAAKGLFTYTLMDAETEKWSQLAMLPTLAVFISLASATVGATRVADGARMLLKAESYEALTLLHRETGRRLSLKSYIEEKWDAECCNPILDKVRECTDMAYSTVGENGWTDVALNVSFVPGFTYRYGYVPLTAGRGFVDSSSGEVLLAGDFETQTVRIRDMHFEWPQVESIDDVPLKPVLRFDTPCLFKQPPEALEAVSIARLTAPKAD